MTRTGAGICLCAVVAAAVVGSATQAPPSSPRSTSPRSTMLPSARLPLVVAQVPAAALSEPALADGTLRRDIGEGGRLVLVDAAGRARVLTKGFASAADPEVSFDGKRVLFAGRKSKTDPWCAWEIGADGSGERQITCGAAGVRQPIYQSTIYTITPTGVEPWVQIAFVGVNPDERNEARVAPNTSLWSCKTDGTALRRLTFNLSNDMDPVVLPDGRMLYAGWLRQPPREEGQGRVALLAVNEDGTDYQTYSGSQGFRVRQSPTPTDTGLVIFVEADRVGGDGAGRLASVRQERPLHTYASLTSASDGLFRAPSALPGGRVLVSWRADESAQYGVYQFDPITGARQKMFDEPGWHSVQARALAPREVPDARSSIVREDEPTGTLYTIDVGIHELGSALPKGTGKTIRVIEGLAARDDRPASRRILGEVPVAADGSYQARVPANTPLQLQLLDADGLAVRTSAWLWVRNHDDQGCLGCHEDPERTPPNRLMAALSQPAPVLTAPESRRAAPSADEVGRLMAEACVPCHGAGGSPPRLDGGVAALAPFVSAREARRSPVLWHLLGRSTTRPWDPEAATAHAKPLPAGSAKLTPDQLKLLAEWIDVGVPQ